MKKLSFLVVFFFMLLCGCAKSFSIENPAKISIQSGLDIVEITDASTISRLTEQITSIQFQRGKSSKGMSGWDYWLIWYDKEGNIIFDAYVSPHSINYNGRFWLCENSMIDTNYYNDLLNSKQESN